MEQRIKNIMAMVFDIPSETIEDSSSPDTIENWESLNHINLITGLEEEFNIRFTDEEIGEMLNFKLINHIINQKLNFK
jgi:acyl carrier protein